MLSCATLAIKKGNAKAFERFEQVAKGISEGSPDNKWFGLQMVVENMTRSWGDHRDIHVLQTPHQPELKLRTRSR